MSQKTCQCFNHKSNIVIGPIFVTYIKVLYITDIMYLYHLAYRYIGTHFCFFFTAIKSSCCAPEHIFCSLYKYT